MESIIEYLRTNIDDNAKLQTWDARKKFNLRLSGSYEYFLVQLLGEEFLLVRPYEQSEIQKMKIQLSIMEKQAKMPIALLMEEITAYRMKKMLQEKVAFIAVGKQTHVQQIYLPFMALHIRKQRSAEIAETVHEKFTPSMQLIFLSLLYSEKEEFCIEEISKLLTVSPMTVIRGMNELKRIGLVDYKISGQTGRKKVFKRIPRKEYYKTGKQYLQNPVKKSFFLSHIPNYIKVYKSGLTALGEQTILGEPNQKVYAVESRSGMLLSEFQVSKEKALDESWPMVQLMKYDISTLTAGEYVDPITLIYGLDQKDERIEIAIGELMEDAEWFVE